MVVDIRYHLASIVAVFLALGLGILVGAALSGGEGLEQQERWLAALESELQSLRETGERNASLLRQTGAERDRYKAFAAELSEVVMRGVLDGERAALVVLGADTASAARVEDILRQGGAQVVRKASVALSWTEADLVRLLAPPEGRAAENAGLALAAALIGQPASGFTSVESPAITFQALSSEQPTIAALVLGGHPDRFREIAASLAAALKTQGIRTAAVVLDEDAWNPTLGQWDVPYVAHFGTPMGDLSLVVLLGGAGGSGGFGLGDGRALWPAQDFR